MEDTRIDPSPAGTLGGELEHNRLQHRARRLELVIETLRERASASARIGPVPSGLQHAIADFSTELSRVRHRLHAESATKRATRGTARRRALSAPSPAPARR